MLCLSKNNTDSISVAPVRYPVVQISFKLNMKKKRKRKKKDRERIGYINEVWNKKGEKILVYPHAGIKINRLGAYSLPTAKWTPASYFFLRLKSNKAPFPFFFPFFFFSIELIAAIF